MCGCWKHHLLLSLSISHTSSDVFVSAEEKMPIFSTTYRWFVLQVLTRRAAVTSTVSSATTTARTRTRWGCTREPRIFISLQCNMCNGQCKQEKVSEDIGRDEQDIENWKKISTIERCAGGGTQAAAPKAGQHHGCRWAFLISTRSYSFVVNFAPFICLLINIFQVLRSSRQRSTVRRQGAVTMGNKPTTTAGQLAPLLHPSPSQTLSNL